jgi:hypothetical protein
MSADSEAFLHVAACLRRGARRQCHGHGSDQAVRNDGCSANRRGLRDTICPSRAVTIGSGLVAMIGTSRLGDITAGISDPCR